MIHINKENNIDYNEWLNIVNQFNMNDRFLEAKSIAIKPNFAGGTRADPKKHIVSNLEFVGKIATFINRICPNAVIYICEGDSTGNGFAYEKFEHLGLPESLLISNEVKSKIKLLDLSRDRLIQVNDERFKFFSQNRKLFLSKKLMEADIVLTLSNMKTHSITKYSGASKNLFGCLPDFDKSHFHTHIHKVVHDLTLAIKPSINIVDGFYGMEKNGPIQGMDIDSGFRVISDSTLETDVYSSFYIGLKPKRVRYLRYLMKTLSFNYKSFDTPKNTLKYKKPQLFLRIMNNIGLAFQLLGEKMQRFGHNIHSAYNPIILFVVIFRPLLTKIFKKETLKNIRRKILNE